MNKSTKIEDLNFPQAWRLKRAVRYYNRGVDKKEELHTVEDLLGFDSNEPALIHLEGVGPKTIANLKELLGFLI